MTRGLPLVVLAAGGTGGHVFPAEALAEELLRRGQRPMLITDRRGNSFGGALGTLETHRIHAGGVAGRTLVGRLRGLAEVGIGFLQARRLLGGLRPALVMGFGGYASVPTVAAAVQARIATAIHEQNAVVGRANRLLAGRVDRIATSFPAVRGLGATATLKAVVTGMPVRPAIAALRDVPYPSIDESGAIRLLVLGGSQGARIFSEIVPAAIARLPDGVRRRLEITQQCRPEDLNEAEAAYRRIGIAATLSTFFRDIPERLGAAHLVIARSGASTVAELTAAGRPAILVPYPYAIDDHQMANAHAVDESGGAWLIPQPAFTAEALAARLDSLFAAPGTLARAAACALGAGRPDAAARLADMVADMVGLREDVPS